MKISKAFTLIEVLIVMTVIAIMSAISVAAMVSIRNERKVEVVAEQIKNRIAQAHADAMAPQNQGITGVVVQWQNSPTRLDIVEQIVPSIPPIFSDTFTGNIIFDSTGSFSFITNDPAKLGQVNGAVTPTIKINSNGKTISLSVNPITGLVTTSLVTSL